MAVQSSSRPVAGLGVAVTREEQPSRETHLTRARAELDTARGFVRNCLSARSLPLRATDSTGGSGAITRLRSAGGWM
jgi:hypothetical protein